MRSGTLHRILLIDDEPVIRETVERALSDVYEIKSLPSGHDLDGLLRVFSPDLIILDIRMPDENGLLICSRLRQDRRFDSVPVIFLTALIDEATVREGFANGGDYYLSKPFNLQELSLVVRPSSAANISTRTKSSNADPAPAARACLI